MGKKQYVIGIDIGTTTTKGCVVTAEGTMLSQFTCEHGVERPYDGWAEQDAESVWWLEFCKVCSTLLLDSGIDPSEIAGIGCSALYPVVLPMDAYGRPLRKAILYGIDSRAVDELEGLKKTFGIERAAQASGNYLSTQSIAPKIVWIRKQEPELFERASKFIGANSYIVHKLTGKYAVDTGTASIGGIPYDVATGTWNEDVCKQIGIGLTQLPSIVSPSQIVGVVQEGEVSELTGLIPGTPVIMGTGDFIAEMMSMGAIRANQAVLTYGTTIGFAILTNKPVMSESLIYVKAPFENLHILGGGLANGASLLKWFKEELCGENVGGEKAKLIYDLLDEQADTIVPGCEGLLALPYFSGERNPFTDPGASGMLIGLTLRHTKSHMYRALYEAIGFSIRSVLDVVKGKGFPVDEILSVGGATKNKTLLRIVSEITGIRQRIIKNQLGAHYGIAFMTACGTGLVKDACAIDTWIGELSTEIVNFDKSNKRIYNSIYEKYIVAYQKNADLMHALKAIH
ncbi:MAG: FGGY family carbohydrate kinase [Sphaerochaeta sp.]|uniref:FGGY-family carbohydrate kinase n=1 Tax=Sphaerochaeta associata TaxID=1129264 RepID=UPI002B1F6763|nr:FGGY family carbohydrate kinase [Sphaerochaeta associata]MEA5030501.1 FGGY family carbohydrate kinase [Sphaerochaeta associata]MEA5031415.1 FGGY family carbohydrate kinase [Sphaerochaeta sp.]